MPPHLPPQCVFHGLRKATLTQARGCRHDACIEIAAISGHKTLKEVERYTKTADQARWREPGWNELASEVSKPSRSKCQSR